MTWLSQCGSIFRLLRLQSTMTIVMEPWKNLFPGAFINWAHKFVATTAGHKFAGSIIGGKNEWGQRSHSPFTAPTGRPLDTCETAISTMIWCTPSAAHQDTMCNQRHIVAQLHLYMLCESHIFDLCALLFKLQFVPENHCHEANDQLVGLEMTCYAK